MIIKIGTTSDDRRKLTKSFSGTDINVKLKDPCDILNPVFMLSYNKAYLTANYIHCPDFNRYYFINNLQILTGNCIEISCSVDVLMSYNQQIKNLNCNILKNEVLRDAYISDSSKPLTTKTQTQTYVFNNNPFVSTDMYTNYVLTVIGGST